MDKALITLLDNYWDNPVWFAEDMLNFRADKWQADVLMDLAKHPKVSVRSGQGVGKTGLESIAVVWYLCTRPFPKVVATAPTMQQLYDVLWAEIAKWLSTSKVEKLLRWTKTKVYMRGFEERWWATARTAVKPENMQGFHEDYMLFVVDEASGIADPIMEAILGTLTGYENKLLMCGNPTKTSGVFYDSHHRDREHYRSYKVSSYDVARTSKDNIKMLIRKYGKDSDVVRVRVFGEFPKAEPDSFIALELVERATENAVKHYSDILDIGVDVARYGNDETVIAPRIGGKVFELRNYNKQGTMETTGHVLMTAAEYKKKYGVNRVRIKIDDTGVGGGVTDRLVEVVREERLAYEIIPVNNGEKPNDEHYRDLGAETWAVLKELLQENLSAYIQGKDATIEIPNDDRLITQLTSRKYYVTSKGKIALERKEDMKKRGLDSPDRADAVVLAFYEPPGAFEPNAAALLRGAKVYD